MANTTAMKRGFHWDEANSKLSIYVDGTEAANFTTTTVNFPTTSSHFNIGTSAAPVAYTAGTPAFTLYATSANTSSTNSEPFYVYSAMTGLNGYGGRSRFHTYSNTTTYTNCMALKAYLEYGSSGKTVGLSAALCAEIKTANAVLGTGGGYFALELEYVAGGTTTATSPTGCQAGFIYMGNNGDADGDFDDNGVIMQIDGLTVGSGHVFQANTAADATHALRIRVGTTFYYIMMTTTGA